MSEDFDTHIILHHLDDPLRIFYWTLDEAAIILVVPFLGLIIEQFFISILIAIFSFWFLRKIKKRYGQGTLKHALYWYFPHNVRKLKKTPPSHIREYLG